MAASEAVYIELSDAGVEVLWDERKERPGVKFKDAELMGLPMQIVVGDRSLERGVVEFGLRGGERQEAEVSNVADCVLKVINGSSH